MTSFAHLTPEQIADLVEGTLGPDDAARARAHLAGCSRCAAEAAGLGWLVERMRSDDSEGAPAFALSRAKALLRQRRPPEPARAGLRELLRAALYLDSVQAAPAAGLRGQPPGVRQLLLRAGDYEVDLRIAAQVGAHHILGQVLGPATTGTAELYGPVQARAALNQISEFEFGGLPAGRYQLLLRLERAEIELPPIDVE